MYDGLYTTKLREEMRVDCANKIARTAKLEKLTASLLHGQVVNDDGTLSGCQTVSYMSEECLRKRILSERGKLALTVVLGREPTAEDYYDISSAADKALRARADY